MLLICEKLMRNNPSLELVKVNAYAKFGHIPSIRSQDIERKCNFYKKLRAITVLKNCENVRVTNHDENIPI